MFLRILSCAHYLSMEAHHPGGGEGGGGSKGMDGRKYVVDYCNILNIDVVSLLVLGKWTFLKVVFTL